MTPVSCGNSRRRYSALQMTPGRRLSTLLVPEVVARRLSTLGLATRNNPSDCLVEQGKILCSQYIRSRMEGEGRRWRWGGSSAATWPEARLVFPRLSGLGRYLERARPMLYSAIGRHAETTTDIDPADMVYSIGVELFKSDITWGKVVSLMAVCGAVANGISRCGRNETISTLVEAASASMQGSLTMWLQKHGGWTGIVQHCQPIERTQPKRHNITHGNLSLGLVLIFLLLYLFKYIFF